MKNYNSPFSDRILEVKTRKQTIAFRKEDVEVIYHYYEDFALENNLQEFTTTETDEVNIQQVYNQYREKYNLPFPEEIQAIREKYQIPASKMSEVLGFGINVYRQYEAGEVPNQSNARLIQLAKDPEEFKKLVLLSGAFSSSEREKILKRIENLIQEETKGMNQWIIDNYLLDSSEKPSSKNGYQRPNIEKVRQVILYLVEHLSPWKMGLNKLLFYADFAHYRYHGKSLMGLRYRAIPLGTVPSNYEELLANTVRNGLVEVEYVEFPNGYVGEKYSKKSNIRMETTVFTDEELESLKLVVKTFSNKTTNEIVNLNHQESAWIENQECRQIVDYRYAFELKGV